MNIEFLAHLKREAERVAGWPEWKRNNLGVVKNDLGNLRAG